MKQRQQKSFRRRARILSAVLFTGLGMPAFGALTIQFNYSLDSTSFFSGANQSRRAILDAAANAVKGIVDRFCGGSIEQLLVGMVDDEVLDEQELQRLAKKIVRLRSTKEEG